MLEMTTFFFFFNSQPITDYQTQENRRKLLCERDRPKAMSSKSMSCAQFL